MGYSQSSLVSCIYDMALRHSTWDNVLDILSASLPECLILVSGDDLVKRTNLVFAQRGLQAAAASTYIGSYASINPWLVGQGEMAPYQVFHDEQMVPRDFEISARSRLSAGPGYLDSVVEDLPFTVFFVSEDMRIQYNNFQAESLRRHNHGPFTSADGILRAMDPDTDAALRQLVQRTVASKRSPTSVMQISRPDDEERYFAIARLAGRSGQPYQLHDAILDPGPLVMLVVHGSSEMASLPTDLLWRAFSFTDSEASLAVALLNGETLADI